MARRYDSRTTIFSPEGRLYQARAPGAPSRRRAALTPPCDSPKRQVEYAIEAISHAGSTVGILSKEGVVLAAEKKVLSKVRPPHLPAALRLARAPPPRPCHLGRAPPRPAAPPPSSQAPQPY